ncbi:MAG: T9SS type A sorting domain-containing protein [Chitinophagales bacterium]
MKNIYLFSLSLMALLFSCSTMQEEEIVSSELYSISDGENALARSNYNLMRLANPNTGEIPSNILQKEYSFIRSQTKKSTNAMFSWQSRGPYNIGGRTRALAVDVLNENRILLGGVSGGMWKSEDGGQSFEKLTTSLMLHSVTCIAQDTRLGFENIWYYGTGELSGNSADLVGHGIYKSLDAGQTWNLLQSTTNDSANLVSILGDFSYVSDIQVNPLNGDLVVASFAGIFLSQDAGQTWQNVLEADASPNGFGYVNFGNQTSVKISKNGVYYASLSVDAIDKGIWRSTDGLNWSNITPTGFTNAYRRIEAAVNPFNQNEVLFIVDATTNASIDSHQLWRYTYLSGDGTGNLGQWTDLSANLPNGDCLGFYDFNFGYYQSQNSYDMVISYHPNVANLVFLGGTNLYKSTDAFSSPNNYSWIGGYQCDANTPSNYVWPNHHPDNHALCFFPSDPNKMLSAHDGGLSLTTNALSSNVLWTNSNNGYGSSQFYTIAIEPGNSTSEKIIGGLQDNGTWLTTNLNPSSAWNHVFYGDGAYCAIASNSESYYVSWQGGKTFKFDIDNLGNTQALTRIDPIGASDYIFINPFILDPNNSNIMYLAAGNYIWRNDSLDAIPLLDDEYNAISLGWERLNASNSSNFFISTNYITALEMSAASSDVLYYGTFAGSIFKLSGLTSGNLIKESIKRTNMPSNAYVSCIETNPNNADEIMLTYSNYEVNSIFHSLDGGLTWTNVSGSLEENPDGSGAGPSVNWAHMYFDGEDSIYLVGTTSGLFVTELLQGQATQWTREAEDVIGNVPVTMISSRTFDKNIVVATHGAGIFSNKIVNTSINDNEVSSSLYDFECYPNPTSHRLNLRFKLDKTQTMRIELYSIEGRKILISEDKLYNKGENIESVELDLPNGYYFLRIKSENQVWTRKVLIKN